ncbi:hypothetical protein Ccrd_016386 [Cynara cardunculus var. scolymus]|uniref:Uncharacterized protein n=1 Tax=Cynara cardunculus var. scolymus TaxID=59895 RepID=A0A118K330_CYNCS|nr:hypothetical protein Ccrd_016386 [Cynara cardunculus var. scolymus]
MEKSDDYKKSSSSSKKWGGGGGSGGGGGGGPYRGGLRGLDHTPLQPVDLAVEAKTLYSRNRSVQVRFGNDLMGLIVCVIYSIS